MLEPLPEDVQAVTGVTPRRWMISPCWSSTGTCSHGYERLKPVAHTIVLIPPSTSERCVGSSMGPRAGGASGAFTSASRPWRTMYSSMPDSTLRIRSWARSVECFRSRANNADVPSKPMNRPVSRTPLPDSVVTSRLRGTGVPMSCNEPSWRACFGSRTLSTVTASRPLSSSHHQMSTPR